MVEGFKAAGSEPRCKGFAIGRSIFFEPAEEWFSNRADDEITVSRIADKFSSILSQWRHYRSQ
nr:DUF2090 domain-containing protein [Oceanicoccus sp. KOV_DT_Chl]